MHRLPSTVSSGPSILPRLVAARTIPSVRLFPSARRGNLTSLPRFSSSLSSTGESATDDNIGDSSKHGTLKCGLYIVGTPIGNLEDITLRMSGSEESSQLSYHKFNESQRETTILRRLHQGQSVALISDAGTPGISDPGVELAKLCISENFPVVPVPGPSALIAALSASGLSTDEFAFGLFFHADLVSPRAVGFLPKQDGSRKDRMMVSSNETATQSFYVAPHKLRQFLEEASSIYGDSRKCVIAREMTKLHEEFWRGTLGEAKEVFSTRQPKGEITLLIEGKAHSVIEMPSEVQLEHELRELVSSGHSLSMAVKMVAEGTAAKRKQVYALALRIFGVGVRMKVAAINGELANCITHFSLVYASFINACPSISVSNGTKQNP
ncbi:hypothetical protein QJS04_geneDACA013080 [Acorus gramineus]|uniref:Tetrapyrrole methylase domain-containing protein n=1 Tax=Acorus gramineus TaxID=55184 RepID=A0AAV9B7D0_ACOGR|nr:hypothetical protein QJS04_geneDACA013080 [Acorus gramineus]